MTGLHVTGDEADAWLAKLAEGQAIAQAGNPVLMNLARQSAKEAISQNLSIPLQVAGYTKAKVVVTFD